MEQKLILKELCSNLERELNERKETNQRRTVEFFSGLKPQMHIGTSKSIPTEGKMAWFVEVEVDGKVVLRESYIPREGEDLNIVEGFMISKFLRNIFTFGIMSSKKFIDVNN